MTKPRIFKVKAVALQMIINGEPTTTIARLDQPLRVAMNVAIKATGNVGRQFKDWQCRDANGVLLEEKRLISDFEFTDGTRLFVSVAVGAGGSGKIAA